jgi:pimeloyl-ACP methyl ester carboxylesterase
MSQRESVIPAQAGIQFVTVGSTRLEYLDIPGDPKRPEILLLHEGLGSVSMWRDFPADVARHTGCRVVAYSRAGFGRSAPRAAPYSPRFMHEEAQEAIPELRTRLAVARPVLVGHSTGASMALLHAAFDPHGVAGVMAMAPLVFVEPSNLESIRDAQGRWESTDWRARLARHHDDADAVFRAWNDTWLDPGFASWDIRADLHAIRAPIVAILGEDDEYSSRAQLDAVRAGSPNARRVEAIVLAPCGHAPHRDQPRRVLAALGALLDAV